MIITDFFVIGGGIIGINVATELKNLFPDTKVTFQNGKLQNVGGTWNTNGIQLSKKWHFKGCILCSAMKACIIYG